MSAQSWDQPATADAPTHAVDPVRFDLMSKSYLKKFEDFTRGMQPMLRSAAIAAYRKSMEDMQKSLDFATVKE